MTARPGEEEKAAGLVARALAAFAAGDFEEAAALAAQAKARAPRSSRVRELIGLAHYRCERWHDALRELLAYRRLTGALDQNHLVADCYRALGRPDRALEVCGEVTPDRVPPDVWTEVLIVAASIHAEQGLLERALAQLSRADVEPRAVEPQHLRLWYVRADILERAGRLDEARTLWERIAAEDPGFFDVAERLEAGST